MLNHSMIKQAAPLICFTLYLITPNNRAINNATKLIYALPFMITIYYMLELNLVSGTWRTLATPLQYSVFTVAIYHRTRGIYGLALSTNMAILCGYLYEIPRYLHLQGLRGLIRVNQYSVFHIDYALLSVLVVAYLLHLKNLRVDKTIIFSALTYLTYSLLMYLLYDPFLSLKYSYAFIYGFRVPWVCLMKLPTMLFLWLTTTNLKYLTRYNV